MSDLVTLPCPACGAPLQVTAGLDRLTCPHCGAGHIVRRSGDQVSLAPATEPIRPVQQASGTTASDPDQDLQALRSRRDKMPALSCLGAIGILVLVTLLAAVPAAALSLGPRAIIAADLLAAIALPLAWLVTHLVRDRRRAAIDDQIARHTQATGTPAVTAPPQPGLMPPRTGGQSVLFWLGVAAGSIAVLIGLAGIVAGFVFLAVPPERDYRGFSVLFAFAAFLVGLIALQAGAIGLYLRLRDLSMKQAAR